MLANEMVEGSEVAGFLLVHVGHEGSEVRVSFHNRGGLGFVYEGGCELAGLVDAKGRGEKVSLFLRQRLSLFGAAIGGAVRGRLGGRGLR